MKKTHPYIECVRGDGTNVINANATNTVHRASSMIAIVSSTNSISVALASLHYGDVAYICDHIWKKEYTKM